MSASRRPLLQAGLHCIEWVELSAKAKRFWNIWNKKGYQTCTQHILDAVRRRENYGELVPPQYFELERQVRKTRSDGDDDKRPQVLSWHQLQANICAFGGATR